MPSGVYKRIKKPKVKNICLQCGKEFEVVESKKNKRKHCSRECSAKASLGHIAWNKGIKTGLKFWLGKKFTKEHRKRLSESHIGIQARENHPQWIKDRTMIARIQDRDNSEYRYWRKMCLERDNFTCQSSGKYGGLLEVHHINNFADFPELRYDIDNGVTLSKESHREFHKKYGRKNNTKEQLEEFINNIKIC